MKISITCSAIILIVGGAWGLRDQQRLNAIRERHTQLSAEAAKFGISVNLKDTETSARLTKRERADGAVEAKLAAKEFIAFALEMEAAEKSGDTTRREAIQERITAMLERIMALDSGQLKILIDEVRAATQLKDEMREGIVGFCIMTLASDHPQSALAIFTESSDLFEDDSMGNHVISTSLAGWAKDDPQAALEWLRKNSEKFPDLITDDAKKGLISGAARQDPQLAFKLISELGIKQPTEAISAIMGAAQTAEERTDSLAALRAHLATLPESEARDASENAIRQLAGNVVRDGFDEASAWLNSAKLSPAELEIFAGGLHPSKQSETGKWVEWLGSTLAPEKSEEYIKNVMHRWTQSDYQAAGTWLTNAPDGPAKQASIRSYAETVAQYEPETAAQWALTLPPGKKRKETLASIYQSWPREDEAGKQAAEAFATQHQINK